MVALTALERLKAVLGVRLAVVHIHHGVSPDSEEMTQFRNRAYQFVREQCLVRKLDFFSNLASTEGITVLVNSSAEEELRRYRHEQMKNLLKAQGFRALVLAHHREDLLVTRVLRLIRGTGFEGLTAMELSRGNLVRPLLQKSRSEIEEYARKEKIPFIVDPSNQDQRYLRNWLVEEWLPQLDRKRPGALGSLARSLELIIAGANRGRAEDEVPLSASEPSVLSRVEFLGLSRGEQSQTIAHYLLRIGARNYTSGHVNEIIKRLKSSQRTFTFVVAGCIWKVTTETISATPRGSLAQSASVLK